MDRGGSISYADQWLTFRTDRGALSVYVHESGNGFLTFPNIDPILDKFKPETSVIVNGSDLRPSIDRMCFIGTGKGESGMTFTVESEGFLSLEGETYSQGSSLADRIPIHIESDGKVRPVRLDAYKLRDTLTDHPMRLEIQDEDQPVRLSHGRFVWMIMPLYSD